MSGKKSVLRPRIRGGERFFLKLIRQIQMQAGERIFFPVRSA